MPLKLRGATDTNANREPSRYTKASPTATNGHSDSHSNLDSTGGSDTYTERNFDAIGHSRAHTNIYTSGDSDNDANCHADSNSNTDSAGDSHARCDANHYANSYFYTKAFANNDPDGDSDFNSAAYSHTERHANAQDSPIPTPAPKCVTGGSVYPDMPGRLASMTGGIAKGANVRRQGGPAIAGPTR
jgi:hypothetical protein